MELSVEEDYGLTLSNVYCGVKFEREDNKQFVCICERDEGYHININGKWYATDGQNLISFETTNEAENETD